MIKTAEEAQKLECRAIGFPDLITGRYGLGQFEQEYDAEPSGAFCWPRCSADECMSWRWHTERELPSNHPEYRPAPAVRRGYCGLAGRPEEGE